MALHPPISQDIIIFGGTGDLAQRKLLPALYHLAANNLMPYTGEIFGLANSERTDEEYRAFAKEAVQRFSETDFDEAVWSRIATRLHYLKVSDAAYQHLASRTQHGTRLIYLAVPPSAFPALADALGSHGIVKGSRVVFEKPFGTDLESSRELDSTIHKVFEESQVFRIDHYLGKETVQNILMFRFANSMFERVWNRDCIDHVAITAIETVGIEGRGRFYEQIGALRDVVQNHVLQVVSLLAMEPPASMSAETIRDEKAKVFHAMRPLHAAKTVRGQYSGGLVDGQPAPGYCEEPGVPLDSATETFFAAKFEIDSWRWAGVPFYVRAGKRMSRKVTEVAVVFRDTPVAFFEGCNIDQHRPNRLVLRIQPEESIAFRFQAKLPGPESCLQTVGMNFSYKDSFMTKPAEAYERLLHDAMDNDATLFLRGDSVERAWEVVQPALDNPAPICLYPAGSWGPTEADELIAPRSWLLH